MILKRNCKKLIKPVNNQKVCCFDNKEKLKYSGVIYFITGSQTHIRRDDGCTGGGRNIRGFGNSWKCHKKLDGFWSDGCGDEDEDCLYTYEDKITNWRKILNAKK